MWSPGNINRSIARGLLRRLPSHTGREYYSLTSKGHSLGPVLLAMAEWGPAQVPGSQALLTPKFDCVSSDTDPNAAAKLS
jgi:hypothetical protein